MDENTLGPLVVKIDTVARLLDCSPGSVRYWIRTGKLPVFKVGKNLRVRMSDVNALITPRGGAQ